MKSYWTQPSLSRDFAVLSATIIFFLILISAWFTYSTYVRNNQRVAAELEHEGARIEHILSSEMQRANYMLTALGRQYVLDKERDLTHLAQVLKSFDSPGQIYSIFSWINADEFVVVSSNRGVLDKPVDISDRDYVEASESDPWKMHIGRPIEGRVSGRWVIPAAIGITDYTGRFLGSMMVSIDINSLSEQVSKQVNRPGLSFAIVSKAFIPLTQVSENKDFITDYFPAKYLSGIDLSAQPRGMAATGSLMWGTGNYAYYYASMEYPYIVLLGYDAGFSDEIMRNQLWLRFMQILVIGAFFVASMWIIRARMIRPVLDMTQIAEGVAKGVPYKLMRRRGPLEIENLAMQIGRISEYMVEIKRIEYELRDKMFKLKQERENAEMDRRNKSEFLAYICQEMRVPLNNVIGFAQVIKDQLYGPVENRKYRQYANDIYQTGNNLLNNLQDLLILSKSEIGYLALSEKPIDVGVVINKSLRMLSERLQTEQIQVKPKLSQPLPKLIADEFRLQQVIDNTLLYLAQRMQQPGTILLEAKLIGESKDKHYFTICLSSNEQTSLSHYDLVALAESSQQFSLVSGDSKLEDARMKESNLGFELARILVGKHGGKLHVIKKMNDLVIVILFGNNRISFVDE